LDHSKLLLKAEGREENFPVFKFRRNCWFNIWELKTPNLNQNFWFKRATFHYFKTLFLLGKEKGKISGSNKFSKRGFGQNLGCGDLFWRGVGKFGVVDYNRGGFRI